MIIIMGYLQLSRLTRFHDLNLGMLASVAFVEIHIDDKTISLF